VLEFFSKTAESAVIVPYTVQEKMLSLKNTLTRLSSDLEDYQNCLKALVEDDDAMALMNLTVLRRRPELYRKPLCAEILRMHDEVEELLESHLIECRSLGAEVSYVVVSIQNAEDSLSLRLNVAQNRVLAANITFNAAIVMISFGGYVSGIFGMNLDNTVTIMPVFGVFEIVFVGTFSIMVIGSYLLLKYFESQGLIPKYVTTKHLLRKEKH
jgi:Mg2+ and Co2+ transporter CorA